MILITGSTGHLGSNVVDQLMKIIPNDQFVVTTSNPYNLKRLEDKGLQARLANFNDDSLELAFHGINKLLLISTMERNRLEQHINVINTAKSQGINHIIYTSLVIRDVESSAVRDLMLSHFQTENYLIESGVKYTILRNTMYADALLQLLGPGALEHNIYLPGGKGRVPYALRREMGEAIAHVLVQQGHENVIYNIVGSHSYSYEDVAKGLQELSGSAVIYHDISEEMYISHLKKSGFPDFDIYLRTGTVKDIKQAEYDICNKTLEGLLGRPTASLKDFLREVFNPGS